MVDGHPDRFFRILTGFPSVTTSPNLKLGYSPVGSASYSSGIVTSACKIDAGSVVDFWGIVVGKRTVSDWRATETPLLNRAGETKMTLL